MASLVVEYFGLRDQLDEWILLQVSSGSFSLQPSILTQVLTTLLIGLLTALAFQLLLACLGLAIGVSTLQIPFLSPKSDNATETSSEELTLESENGFGIWIGLGVLLTFNGVLFAASFLATRFSQINSPAAGAIAGVVIWSAYFLLLLWLSSTAVSSVLGLLINLTTVGFRRILSTIMASFQANDEPVSSEQLVATVRQELQNVLSDVDFNWVLEEKIQKQLVATSFPLPQANSSRPSFPSANSTTAVLTTQPSVTTFWQATTDYLSQTDAKKLTPKRLERKLEKLFQTLQTDLPDDIGLATFNPALLEATLAQRNDLTDKKKQRITAQIETLWNTFIQTYPSTATQSDAAAVDQAEVSDDSSPLNQTAHVSQAVMEAVSEQVFHHLPAIAQRLEANFPEWKALAPLVMPIARAKVTDFVESISDKPMNLTTVKEAAQEVAQEIAQDTIQQPLEQAIESSQAGLTILNRAVGEQLETLRDRATTQIESLQQAAEAQTNLLKLQAQQRIEAARQAAVKAIWWLFMTALTGAASAAFAGAIASGFNPLAFISQISSRL